MIGLGCVVWVDGGSDAEFDKLNRDLSGYFTRHGVEDKGYSEYHLLNLFDIKGWLNC